MCTQVHHIMILATECNYKLDSEYGMQINIIEMFHKYEDFYYMGMTTLELQSDCRLSELVRINQYLYAIHI